MNIEDVKRSRDALKGYFVKNAIPTQDQFAQLIDSGLNQREDRLVKPADGPLSIEATGPESGPRRVLDFYENLAEAQPTFSLGLRMKPGDARRGLTIGDGAGNSRLAIETASGNVGIGTTEPKQRLDVAGDVGLGGRQALSAPDTWLRLNQSGQFAAGTQTPGLFAPGSLNVGGLNGNANPGGSNAVVAGSLGIGVFAPQDRVHVDGRVRAGTLTVGPWPANPGTYAFIGSNLQDQANVANYALLVGTGGDVGATSVNGSASVSLRIRHVAQVTLTAEGRLGVGTTTPRARLEVAGGAIMPAAGEGEAAGILFPPDAFGGSNDRAWIRWVSRGGEATTLEIGTADNPDDHIALMPSGSVGIGTRAPAEKLQVEGRVRAGALTMGSWPANAAGYSFIGSNLLDQGKDANYALLVGTAAEPGCTLLNSSNYIGLRIGNRQRLIISKEGNVGIGTDAPAQLLDVNGRMRIRQSASGTPSAGTWLSGYSNSEFDAAFVGMRDTGSVGFYGNTGTAGWRLWTDIGNGNLFVTGAAFKPGGGAWANSSDARLKREVRPLAGALERLLQLRPVTFEWIAPERQGNQTGPQIGLIAQEVEPIFPDWVVVDHEGYRALSIRGFEALAVEALRQLESGNAALRRRVAALEARIDSLTRAAAA